MQVTHERDHVTHAVIGGKKTIDFGISDSPEFFNILSSTLYRDQMLAVVREVLCNAWDAHIDAGVTDRAVQVTFQDDKFIVRDFGKGIHSDFIGPIYGTYGGSTKKNDGKQTGGFGLGCKAPFAYTDHFEVVSYHQGTMTIYAMSKSSAEVAGKPGITPIVSAPTTESGLQVTIKVKNDYDRRRFKELVSTIAFNGDMFVTVNGDVQDKLGFTDESCFLISSGNIFSHKINVRYGNVIYPVESSDGIATNYSLVRNILDSLAKDSGFKIVFQAPPHSIAVTPSRESLSMQEHTCATLNLLFTSFITDYQKHFEQLLFKMNTESYQKLSPNIDAETVLSRTLAPVNGFPGERYGSKWPIIRTIATAAEAHLKVRYPKGWAFRKHDLRNRIQFLLTHNKIDKNLAISYLREMDRLPLYDSTDIDSNRHFSKDDIQDHSWMRKCVIKPLVSKILAEPKIDLNRLYLSDNRACVMDAYSYYHSQRFSPHTGLIPVKKAVFPHMPTMLPYLRNIVVLAYSRLRVAKEERIRNLAGTSVSQGSGFFIYIVERRKDDLANARNFFQKRGMNIIDYTEVEDAELKARPAAIKKPRRKGLAKMNTVYVEKNNTVNLHRLDDSNVEFIEDPKFFIRVNIRRDSMSRIEDLYSDLYRKIFKRYGHLGGIVTTTRQEETYRNRGLPHFSAYITKDIIDYVSNSQGIQEYWAYQPERLLTKCKHRDILDFILDTPDRKSVV